MKQFSRVKFSWLKARRVLAGIVVVVCVVLIELWINSVHNSPSSVFWGMITKNLSTTGATVQVKETASGSFLDETIQFGLGSHNVAQATVNLDEGAAKAKTETISTPKTDYTRYLALSSSKTGSAAYKNILNIWATSVTTAKGQPDPLNHLLGQTVLGVVPFASLPGNTRQSLLNEAESTNVYTPDFSDVTRAKVNGQAVYVYKVSVNPRTYAAFAQQVSDDEHLGTSSEFNSVNYLASSKPINVQLSIIPSSRELVAVSYGSGHSEVISGYGTQPRVTIPTHTISISQLENRVATAGS